MDEILQPRIDLSSRTHDCNDQPSLSPELRETTTEDQAEQDRLVYLFKKSAVQGCP